MSQSGFWGQIVIIVDINRISLSDINYRLDSFPKAALWHSVRSIVFASCLFIVCYFPGRTHSSKEFSMILIISKAVDYSTDALHPFTVHSVTPSKMRCYVVLSNFRVGLPDLPRIHSKSRALFFHHPMRGSKWSRLKLKESDLWLSVLL